MRFMIIIAVALALSGCMSYESTVNGNTCRFSGYGIIGGAIAKSNYDECVEQARVAKKS